MNNQRELVDSADKLPIFSDGAVTVSEAVKVFMIGRTALYKLMEHGELPYIKFGARRLIPRRALVEMMENLRPK